MNTGILIQARLGSERLPRKVLRRLGHKPVLQHVIDRCKETGIPTYVATPDEEIDTRCHDDFDCPCYWKPDGDENDVLLRCIEAARHFNLECIIRVCADCPLIDPADILELTRKAEPAFGYVAYWCADTGKPAVQGHAGMPELIHLLEMERIYDYTRSCREHVTIGAYRPLLRSSLQWIRRSGLGKQRNTIDTAEDLERIHEWLTTSKSPAAK